MAAEKPHLRSIASISLAHLINDGYSNFIQTLLPFFVAAGMGVGKGAFLISAFTASSSVVQPLFGYLVDRRNQRWMVYVGTLWMGVLLGLLGLTNSYPLLFALALFSGFGTAAFHPQAAASICMVSGNRHGLFQAVFTAAGNVGYAVTPLLVVPLVAHYGLSVSPVFIIPGVLGAALLLFSETAVRKRTAVSRAVPIRPLLRANWRELLKIIVVVSTRSVTYYGLIAFLPLYLQTRGVPLVRSSRLLFLMLFSGAIGGIIGGALSDRFGRRIVIAVSLLLSAPFFYSALHSTGVALDVLLALGGACLLASFSITVVLAQEIISKNAAMASGLTLGFGIGLGGLAVGPVGLLIESQGLSVGLHLLVWFPLVAGLAAISLKRRAIPREA